MEAYRKFTGNLTLPIVDHGIPWLYQLACSVSMVTPSTNSRHPAGTALSKETAEYRWLPTFSEVDDSCDSVDLQEEGHCKTLELTMAVLSPDVKEGEVQVGD